MRVNVRVEEHRRKDGGMTIKPVMLLKKKPRRKRRDNHGMRRTLIQSRQGR